MRGTEKSVVPGAVNAGVELALDSGYTVVAINNAQSSIRETPSPRQGGHAACPSVENAAAVCRHRDPRHGVHLTRKKKNMKHRHLGCIATAAALIAGPAQASFAVYTSEAAFLAVIATPGVDNFDDLGGGYISPPGLNRTAGTHTYTISGDGGLYSTGPGTNYNVASYFGSFVTLDNFGPGVRGVGGNFFVASRGFAVAAPLQLQIVAIDADGPYATGFINAGANGFFGVVSTRTIQSVTVNYLARVNNDSAHVDNVVLGTTAAVPEPASYLFMLAGLAGMGVAARRRRSD